MQVKLCQQVGYGFKGEVKSPGIYTQALHYVLWDRGLKFRRPTVKLYVKSPAPSWNTAWRRSERHETLHPLTCHRERYWLRREGAGMAKGWGKTDDLFAPDNAKPELHFLKMVDCEVFLKDFFHQLLSKMSCIKFLCTLWFCTCNYINLYLGIKQAHMSTYVSLSNNRYSFYHSESGFSLHALQTHCQIY